jgi:flagellar hook-associated protein 2
MATSSTSSSSNSAQGFNGTSSFSADFQNVISRAVQIASLPITNLQNQENTLTSQQSELQTLGSDFQSLQTAISSVSSAISSGSFSSSVDAPTVASASVGTGVLAGSYAVTIASLGSQTNTISNSSLPTVSDPSSGNISTSSAFTLSVNGTDYSLTPASNNLNSLVQAINSSGANVQATIVNVGGSSTPNYQLSIQGADYSPTAIQLNDGSQDLLTNLSTGSYVTYQVNGQPSTPATSTSRALTISPGLTVNALSTGTANVTVSQNSNGVQNALSSLVTAYNAAVDELTKNRGQNGGALAGNSVVQQLSNTLHSMTNYVSSSSGSIQTATDIGLSFDQNGHLQVDPTALNNASGTALADALNFLGTSTGTGFVAAATTALNAVTDPTSGLITTNINSLGTSITNITNKISSEEDQVTQLQTNLTAQMSAADAAVAALQQQVTQITNLFAAQMQASKDITG